MITATRGEQRICATFIGFPAANVRSCGQGITTIAELAAATDDARPDAIGVDTFGWLREQAQVQGGGDDWLIISPQSATAGVFGTPKPHPDDMYFDLEGDPFAAIPTLDYLWAYCDVDGTYHHRWAHSPTRSERHFYGSSTLREREKRGGIGRSTTTTPTK